MELACILIILLPENLNLHARFKNYKILFCGEQHEGSSTGLIFFNFCTIGRITYYLPATGYCLCDKAEKFIVEILNSVNA